MALDFIRAPSKASLLAMLKKAKEINPRLLRSLFDGVIFKSEMTNYLSSGGVDHGNLSGLADDDHLQYGLTNGSRPITGQQTFNAGILTDTVGEKTPAAGVTVDGLLIKDGNIAAIDYAFVTANDGATSVTAAELEELTDASETELHTHALEGHEHETVSFPSVCLASYVDVKARNADYNLHGGIDSLATGQPLDSVPTDLPVTAGTGKLMIVVNAGTDLAGDITVTGTSVDRNTGAETGADTDTITVDALTTDGSDTDASGNIRHSFTGAYITSKWFKGSVVLSTADLTLTDVDVYQVSFEQWNDSPNTTIDSFDFNGLATNSSAWLYSYLYSLVVANGKCDITREASLDLPAAEVSANKYYRLRRGNLGIALDGTTDGFWVDMFPGPLASVYWEDMNIKVWATIETDGNTIENPIWVGSQFWNWEDSPVQAGIPSNVYSNYGIVNPEVADDTLTIGTYSVASLGYTKTYNMDAQSTATYNYFQLSSAISSGTIRMEVLVGMTAAAGSQADFFHYITDLAASAKNWIGNSISKNGGNPRHRGYSMSDESNVTCIDTTTTGTWVSPGDDTGWCLCQLEYDFSTRVLKSEFINLETGHTTGQETSAAQTALDAPLEFLRIGPRNISGNIPVYMAQIWVGTADDEWPAGKLNGFG